MKMSSKNSSIFRALISHKAPVLNRLTPLRNIYEIYNFQMAVLKREEATIQQKHAKNLIMTQKLKKYIFFQRNLEITEGFYS